MPNLDNSVTNIINFKSCSIALKNHFSEMSNFIAAPTVETSPYNKRLRSRSMILKPNRFNEESDIQSNECQDDLTPTSNERKQSLYIGLRNRSLIPRPNRFNEEFTRRNSSNGHNNDTSAGSGRKKESQLTLTNIENVEIEEKGAEKNKEDENKYSDAENSSESFNDMVHRNIEEKMDFLQSHNIPEAMHNFVDSLQKQQTRQLKGHGIKTHKPSEPMRSSKRLLKLEPEVGPLVDKPKLGTYNRTKKNHTDEVEEEEEEDNDSDAENIHESYNDMVQRNIREKMAFLQSLNIPEATQNFVDSLRKKPKRQSNGLGTKTPLKRDSTLTPTEPRRSSKRLRRQEPDGGPLLEKPKLRTYSHPYSNDPYKTYTPRKPTFIPLGLKATCRESDFNSIQEFLNGLSGDLAPTDQKNHVYTEESLKKMVNTEAMVAKVTPDRVYSLAVHPGITSRRLVASGGKLGYLGLWDVGSSEGEDGVFLFRPCHDSINCLSFEAEALICSSYEGTLKKLDLRVGEFDHLYATPDAVMLRCTHFDSLTDQCYIVSLSDGTVVTVDPRTKGTSHELELECHEKLIKTVSVHPHKRDYFLTASNDGSSRIWDLRNHKALKPVAEVSQGRSVNCAYFSPVSGNYFHTLSYNDTARVYDCTDLGSQIKQTCSIRHDNQVGRWVTPFRGQWIPNTDNLFAVGSKSHPRSVDVFYASNGKNVHSFTSPYLQSINSIIAFHPKIPFLAGGNASGKVYVFANNGA